MRITNLHTICILVLNLAGAMASAQQSFDPSMEAGLACASSDCEFRGLPQVAQGLGGLQKIPKNETARLIKVNEYKDNPEQVIPRAKFPQFNAIGMVQRMSEIVQSARNGNESNLGHGTALNLGPCTVLTNYHVPFGTSSSVTKFDQYKMRYNIGYSATASFEQSSEITPKLAGDLTSNDFSLSQDPKCSGSKYGWYKPSDLTSDQLVARHATVLVVSFPGDQGNDKMAISKGVVTGIDPNTGNVLYTASTSPGSSGGAVFIIDENGDLRLQGIHVGGAKDGTNFQYPTYTQEHANQFLNVAELFERPDVARYVNSDITNHPGTNPIERYTHVRN